MKVQEVLDFIKASRTDGILTLSPGPFKIKIGESDRKATALLDWFKDTYPDATIQEITDTLLATLWWMVFWAAMPDDELRRDGMWE